MDLAMIIGLVVLGIIFILLELFFLPGISIASIGGIICFAVAVVLAYTKIGAVAGSITLVAAMAATGISIWLFLRSKALDKMALDSEIDSSVKQTESEAIQVGDHGKTLSRLAPTGKILVRGISVEAKAENEMIDEDSEVEVIAVDRFHVVVKKTDENPV